MIYCSSVQVPRIESHRSYDFHSVLWWYSPPGTLLLREIISIIECCAGALYGSTWCANSSVVRSNRYSLCCCTDSLHMALLYAWSLSLCSHCVCCVCSPYEPEKLQVHMPNGSMCVRGVLTYPFSSCSIPHTPDDAADAVKLVGGGIQHWF